MGIIKKIIDRELVGGTTNEEVYPISSTKAIYDTNNNTLEYILKGLLSKIEEVSARHGYYICSTISSDPDKEITIPNFELSTNVRLLVKMGYSNTVNDVSFEVNNTGAYPLYYNEAPASKNNTWASNEVLDIYFNGNSYQAFSSKEDSSQGYWELVNDSNGISYIKTKYPVVSEQGVTAYGGNPLIPSIFDGLPLDNTTIRKNLTTGLIEVIGVIGGGGGTVTPGDISWNDITDKPSWIGSTKPSYSWSEITGEAPFYTKAEIDGKYVTVTTEQEVTGLKHFINGISIGSNKKKIYEQDGVVYIDSDVAVTGGITVYAKGEQTIPDIWEGAPFDNVTIHYNPTTKIIEVLGATGSNFDEEAMWTVLSSSDSSKQINASHLSNALSGYATESWVTSNNYATQSWVQSQGYATQSALNSVSSKLNDFLEGSDTDTIINKWKELEAFLSGMTESDNLAEILSTKADKSFVTSELTKYVTLATEQDITAIKHFTQGLSVGTSKHKIYEKDGAVILEGNLLVTGGVTAYSTGEEGGGSSGGIDVDLLWEILGGTGTQQINKSHLTTALSGYATESWVTSKNYATKATTLAGYGITDAYTKTEANNAFVNVSGDTMTGNLQINSSNSSNGMLKLNSVTGESSLSFLKNGTPYITFGLTSYANDSYNSNYLGFYDNANIYGGGNKWYKIWHAGNDGSGSGLDADLLDGLHASDLLYTFNTNDFDPNAYDGYYAGMTTKSGISTDWWHILSMNWGNGSNVGNKLWVSQLALPTQGRSGLRYRSSNSEASYSAWIKVWDESNDGSGSGLDADLLDGKDYNQFLYNFGQSYGSSDDIRYIAPWTYFSGQNMINAPVTSWFSGIVIAANGNPDYKAILGFNEGGILYAGGNLAGGWRAWQQVAYTSSNVASASKLLDRYNNDEFIVLYSGKRYDNTWERTLADNGWYLEYNGAALANVNSNVASATKLQTPRNIWGKAFDGTADISGDMNGVGSIEASGCVQCACIELYHSTPYIDFHYNNSNNDFTSRIIADENNIMNINYVMYIGLYSNVGIGTNSPSQKLHVVGNILATGGVTCYSSDARAKTIIEELNLSLKQISESPIIRFKWNGWNIPDDGKTHIGGIAQYVQKILPECILDADGVLNMDYATTAYIYSVQTARHLQTYETRTDRKIKKLEKEIKILKSKLKQLGYEDAKIA